MKNHKSESGLSTKQMCIGPQLFDMVHGYCEFLKRAHQKRLKIQSHRSIYLLRGLEPH